MIFNGFKYFCNSVTTCDNIINYYNFFTFNGSKVFTNSSFTITNVILFSVFIWVENCKGCFNTTHVF